MQQVSSVPAMIDAKQLDRESTHCCEKSLIWTHPHHTFICCIGTGPSCPDNGMVSPSPLFPKGRVSQPLCPLGSENRDWSLTEPGRPLLSTTPGRACPGSIPGVIPDMASLRCPSPVNITLHVDTSEAYLCFLSSPLLPGLLRFFFCSTSPSCSFPWPQPYIRPSFLPLIAVVFSCGAFSVSFCPASAPDPAQPLQAATRSTCYLTGKLSQDFFL